MSDYKARLFDEFDDLTSKTKKLEAFVLSPEFESLPPYERRDLKEQYGHMQKYLEVLMRRCSRECG